MLHRDNLEFLEDVVPKTAPYRQVKDQAAATRAKLKGGEKDKKKAGEDAAAAGGLPNGKRQKSAAAAAAANGSDANGRGPSRALGDDDPGAQLELEMRQAQQGDDGDVDMTG